MLCCYWCCTLRTCTLVVDARSVERTVGVAPAADVAHRPVANLPAPAIVVLPAQRFAHGRGQIALFVTVAIGVGRAHRLTGVVLARIPGRTFSVLVTRFGRRSDARYFGRGIRDEPHPAGAHGPLVGHGAHGVGPAGHCQTWIRAHVVPARFDGCAILVGLAPEQAHVVQAYMPQKAIVVHSASHWKSIIRNYCNFFFSGNNYYKQRQRSTR